MLPESLFVTQEVHEREVTLGDGSKHKIWLREVSQKDMREFGNSRRSEDPDAVEGASAKLISQSLCEPDGTLALTFERALELKPAALNPLLQAVMIVNRFEAGNDSPPGEKSGSTTS